MGRGTSKEAPCSILYGQFERRSAADELPRPWRDLNIEITADEIGKTNLLNNTFEGHNGWTGSGSFLVREDQMPAAWLDGDTKPLSSQWREHNSNLIYFVEKKLSREFKHLKPVELELDSETTDVRGTPYFRADSSELTGDKNAPQLLVPAISFLMMEEIMDDPTGEWLLHKQLERLFFVTPEQEVLSLIHLETRYV